MEQVIRRRLEAAERAVAFLRANPFTDPANMAAAARLEELVKRANVLIDLESAGRTTTHAAVLRRIEIRRDLLSMFLRPVARAGQLAARQKPELVGKFRVPSSKTPLKNFLVDARNTLNAALAEKEIFAAQGISEAMLEELGKEVTAYQQETENLHTGRRTHVGARAELKQDVSEIGEVLLVLDGLNQRRFRNDPEKLAAWNSDRNVFGPFRSRREDEAAEGPVSPGTKPPADDATKSA